MLGKECCYPQCIVSVTAKHAGIKLFQITTRRDDFYQKTVFSGYFATL